MTKITDFPVPTTPIESADLVPIVENPSGTAKNVRATLSELFTLTNTNITCAGTETVDGRDVSVDGAKLDTIETDADKSRGKRTLFVPAAACIPSVSGGCASITTAATGTSLPDVQYLAFDQGTEESAQFQIAFPKSWNLGTVTYQVYWDSTSFVANTVRWGLQGVSVSDADSMLLATFGTAITVDDANSTIANAINVSPESGAVTIAGTPALGDMCFFRLYRDATAGADTLTTDARLLGIRFFYTTNAGNDA